MGLETLQKRLEFQGGVNQQARMNQRKLESLKSALLYSYQAATAVVPDGKEFRCLINPDKLKRDYDEKMLSIPFEDICLNDGQLGRKIVHLKAGDVFTWKENQTDWIVYLQRLEETAYYRAEIRQCRYETIINDSLYKVYACGPHEEEMVWNLKKGTNWNDLNYTLEMYITKNEDTEQYLKRFAKIKLNNKPWEVQAVDNMSMDGVIIAALKEDYSNPIAEEIEKEKNVPIEEPEEIIGAYIDGETEVYPYEHIDYEIKNAEGGYWSITGNKAQIVDQDDKKVCVFITSGKSGKFDLNYIREDRKDIVLTITVNSL